MSLITFLITIASLAAPVVHISWNPNPEADLAGYNIYRANRSGSTYTLLNQGLILSNRYSDPEVDSGNTYFYVITAVDTQGRESDFSEEVRARLPRNNSPGGSAELPVNAGRNLKVYATDTIQLAGQVEAQNRITYFWEHLRGPAPSIIDAGPASVSLVPPPVSNNSRIRFRLNAVSDKGETGSDEIQVTVQPPAQVRAAEEDPGFGLEVSADQNVQPGTQVQISAKARGQIGSVSYHWKQIMGPRVDLNLTEKGWMSFTAPHESTLVFEVTARNGLEKLAKLVTIDVSNYLLLPVFLEQTDVLLNNSFVGAAILNPNDAYSNGATVWSTRQTPEGREAQPRLSVPLSQRGQVAFVTEDVQGSKEGPELLLARGENGPIQGFFMIGDKSLQRMDGIGGSIRSSTILYFPLRRSDLRKANVLSLFNPRSERSATAQLILRDRQGQSLDETFLEVTPLGSFIGELREIFDSPDLESALVYLEVRSDLPLVGFNLDTDEKHLTTMLAQIPRETGSLVAPHFFADREGGGTTELQLLNPQDQPVPFSVELYDEDSVLITTHDSLLQTRELLVLNLREILQEEVFKNQNRISGSLKVNFTSPAVVSGSVTYIGTEGGGFQSTLPALDSAQSETLFLHVAQSANVGMSTGLALLNDGDSEANVQVQSFDTEGNVVAETTVQLAPGQRLVELLASNTFFGPAFSQVGGHVSVSSDAPVYSFALFFSNNLRFMSSIQGQQPVR